jgi:hypothetical protein
MIKSKIVKLKINSKTISHYRELGYNVDINKIYDIKVEDLTKGSKIEITAICDSCGDEKNVTYKEYCRNISKYNIFCCSNKCAQIKNKKTNLEKYGVEHYSKTIEFVDKIKNTNLCKFGYEYYTQTEEYKNRIKINNKNRDYTDMLSKIKSTTLLKYGNENYHKSEDFKNKKESIIKKYKNTITNKLLDKYDNLISTDNKNYKFLCENSHEFEISRELLKNRITLNTVICTVCNPIGSSKSGYEIQLADFISNNISTEIIRNNRTILDNKYELDIYIPNLKIALEFNGLYWHDELHKENNYHLNKTELCEKQGIQLMHIWEDDWLYKQDIIKSIILNKLGQTPNEILSEKCEIKELNNIKIIRDFLNNNHIKGFVASKIRIGLFYENELVSLMTFCNSNISINKNEYELISFCNKLNTNIIGSINKLLNYFVNNYNPEKIITYINRSISQGELYKINGFEYESHIKPNYCYVIDGLRNNKLNYRKNILVKQGYDINKTEHQIMIDRKIYRIYDSGQLKFVYKIKTEN